MNIYSLLSTILNSGLFVFNCIYVLRGKSQSIASWGLWGVLVGIAAVTIALQGGNYWLALTNAIGNGAVFLCILKSGDRSWTWFETTTLFMVLVCIVFWVTSGPRMATIMATVAFVLAGFPQLKDTYKKPWNTSALLYSGYSISALLAVFAGKAWSVEERFFPGTLTFFNSLVAIVALRKLWVEQA